MSKLIPILVATLIAACATDDDGRQYVKHFLIDMGATLGSSSVKPRTPKSGNEYFVDVRYIVPSMMALGLYHKPWEEPMPMPFPELGYLESVVFDPGRWVTNYPKPSFQRCTARDGYWGAKIVMNFTDEDIEAVVETGQLSNPAAAQELVRLLKERRDKIGRYWCSMVNPLDRFWIDRAGLHFEDLAVVGKIARAEDTGYRYRVLDEAGEVLWGERKTQDDCLPVPGGLKAERFYAFEIFTDRVGAPEHAVRVYFYKWGEGRYQIVRVERAR